MTFLVSIVLTACVLVMSACGTSARPAAEPAVAATTSERPPPLTCEMRSEMILDHFGIGKGADTPKDAAASHRAPGSTLVVEKGDEGATIHVVSADGAETLAIMRASNWDGWRIDTIESCLSYKPNVIAKR